MASSKELDITKVGPVGFRQLQAANELDGGNEGLSEEYLAKKKKLLESTPAVSPGILGIQPDRDVMSPLAGGNVGWGESRYDDLRMANQNQFENLADLRAEQQPWYSKIANGLGKGVILTGTTFLDGTVGLVFGAGTAIAEGRWSGLWDNDFSKAMQAVNDWSEQAMPNYYTEEEQQLSRERPLSAQNIFSANFIGDKFLKNLGFTVGAFYSGSVAAKAIQATKLPNLIGKAAMAGAGRTFNAAAEAGSATKLAEAINAVGKAVDAPAMVTSAVGTVISAVNEGRIEALNNTRDWYNLEKAKLDDFAERQAQEIEAEYNANQGKEILAVTQPDGTASYIDPAFVKYQQAKKDLQGNYEMAMAKLNEDRAKMGNADLLMNLPILIASNAIEFGKLYANGYKTARKGVNIVNKSKYAGKDLSTAWAEAQAAGIGMKEFAQEFAQFGTEEAKKGLFGTLGRVGKNMATTALPEGLEEISQKAASTIAGDYYSADVHNFYTSKMDPDATEETISWAKAFAQGINETINDGSSWEEFFIGALTGALGMPVFGRANTSASDTYLGKGKAVGLRGGIFGEMLANREEAARANTVANYINDRIKSPELINYYQGMTRHNAHQAGMDRAAINGDEFNFKNHEFAQMVSDIMMFDNAGKIGDLLTLINSAYDTSTENLESIIKNTTSIQTDASGAKKLVGPFAKYATINAEGKVAPNFGDEAQQQEMAQKLTESRDEMLKTISDYQLEKDKLDIMTGQRLSDDQLQELTWIKMQSKDWAKRGAELAGEARNVLSHISAQMRKYEELSGHFKREEGAHSKGKTRIVNGKEIRDFGPSEEYEALSEKERAFNRIANVINDSLKGNDEDLFRALGNPANKKVVDSLKDLAKGLVTVSPEEIEDFNRKLDDIAKLDAGIRSYNTKLSEFLKNPEKQAAEMNAAAKKVATETEDKKKNAIARRINFNAPTAEVAKALDENSKDITAMGGFDEFIKVLTPEEAKKAKAAKHFSQALNSVRSQIDESDLSNEQKRVAQSLLDKEAAQAKDIKEVGQRISAALDRGEVKDALASAVPTEEIDDLARLTLAAETEAALKDLFEDSIKKAADAVSALEKTDSDNLKKAADALSKKEKKGEGNVEAAANATTASEEKGSNPSRKSPAEQTLKDMVPKEPKGPDSGAVPKEPRSPEGRVPTEDSEEDEPYEPQPGERVGHARKQVKDKQGKEVASPSPGSGGSAYDTRPQIYQHYRNGRNGTTYLDYILQHPDVIPAGIDKEAFVKYITTILNYLNEHHSFDYVNGVNPDNKLSLGDTIEFKVDEELNRQAGTPIVLMVAKNAQGEEQVIGSLPSELDFNGTYAGTKQILKDKRPAQYALYNAVLENSKTAPTQTITADGLEDVFSKIVRTDAEGTLRESAKELPEEFHEALGDAMKMQKSSENEQTKQGYLRKLQNVATKFAGNPAADAVLEALKITTESTKPITTRVTALRGGRIEFSDSLERTVAATFAGTPLEDAPVIAVLSEETSGLTTGDDELDASFVQPTADGNAITWGVYAMVPTNNGKYLPALCYSTEMTEIVDDPDDWYMQQTVAAIQKIPTSIADLKDNIRAVYKWLNIPGLSLSIGRLGEDHKFQKETADVSAATHVRMSFSNPKKPNGRPIQIFFDITDGALSADQIRTKLADTIKKNLSGLTTNVDIKRLTNRPADKEYRKNISRYLTSNIASAHSVNDWFNYEPTDIERNAVKKEKEEKKPTQPIKKEGKGQEVRVTYNGAEYTVMGNTILDADNKPVDTNTAEAILKEMSKPADATPVATGTKEVRVGDKVFTAVNMGGGKAEVKVGRREAKGNRWSKKLRVTDTDEAADTEEHIYQNAETVRRMLPQLSEAGRVVIVNGLIRTVDESGNPIDAYGEFRDGVLYISNQSPAGTAYHEAFHYVTTMLMDETEQATMLEEAKKQYGELSDIALEEKLSESFRDYMNGYNDKSLLGRIKTFFRNLKHVIDGLTGRLTYLDSLFYNIYRGRYSNRQERFGTFEEQRILRNAPRDSQGRLLAPNGKPSNLTERQYAQVRTQAFKDWFGDWENDPKNASKVVDENGEPMVVYHGNRTNNKIEVFDKSKIGSQHKKIIDGFWFITDKELAKFEYSVKSESVGKGFENLQFGEVLPVFLNLRNPVTETQKGLKVSNSPFGPMATAKEGLSEFISRVQNNSENNDGFILTVVDSDGLSDPFYQSRQVQLVAKESNQIKSATENTGRFSPNNDNFYDRLVAYKSEQLAYDNLDNETKQSLEAKRVSQEDYNDLSIEEKENILFCLL